MEFPHQKDDDHFRNNNEGILDNRFCLIGTLGSGGTAKVYLAYDLRTHGKCAIK